MSLEFAEFADFYRDSGLSDAQQREHFECFSNILECVARMYWTPDSSGNLMGIKENADASALIGMLESSEPLREEFDEATGAAGRGEAQ